MIKLEGNKIEIKQSRTLTPKQMFYMKHASETEKRNYFETLLGIRKDRVYINRCKTNGDDKLKSKHDKSILRLLEDLRRTDVNHHPSANDKGMWIGVEIECIIPGYESQSDCKKDLKCAFNNKSINRVSIKSDGSLDADGDDCPIEVTILFNLKSGYEPLMKLCSVLEDFGAYINSSCGLHVHLDVRNESKDVVRRIGRKIARCLPVLKYIMPKNRLNNTYCKIGMSRMSNSGDRYFAVNLKSYQKFKTIEIRLHNGSVNFEEIKNWIDLLTLIRKSYVATIQQTFQQLCDTLNLSDVLTGYVEKRIDKYNPDAWPKIGHSTITEVA